MTPLVLQLQADALDPDVGIADLLRKAKVVAAKLDLAEFREWIEHELNGYAGRSDIPEYRRVHARVKARHPRGIWVPIIIEDHDVEQTVSSCEVGQAIGALEDVIERSKKDAGFLAFPLPGAAQQILARWTGFNTEYQLHFDASNASGILDAVRNRVLDWSISLEKAGITGEGMTFSGREKEVAKAISSGNTYNIQNVGVLGDVAHSSISTHQSVTYTANQLSEIRSVVEQIDAALPQLSGDIRGSVDEAIRYIKAELQQPAPSSSKLHSALASIRTTCEGAAGNLIASGIIGLIGKLL
ncbi:MAG TPA: hypothetical protein VGE72_06230 [Azospirillum sp.]